MTPPTATATETSFARYLTDLNHEYVALHTTKEDAFWAAYMGLTSDPVAARADLAEKEIALQRFLQDPARLAEARDQLKRGEACLHAAVTAECPTQEEIVALKGWLLTFESNVIDSAAARALAEEIIADEGALANVRGAMKLGYQVPGGDFVEGSSNVLATMLRTNPDAVQRKAAWEGLRSIEDLVLANGFIDIIKKRNALGRMLGGEDYYDWKVRRVEGMSKRDIFELLDDLEVRTREAAQRSMDELKVARGEGNVNSWSIQYLIAGDVTTAQDPYYPFAEALERWGRSFAAMGIDYQGADLVLDLVDRKGKYENGFMHGPEPAWRDRGEFHRARIQFTANAIPGMVGSGKRATETLFHEGGHAAHFANIDMPAPCFAQEFAPSSVAMAETQSMFLDSLLDDPEWMSRYARTADGQPMPWELIAEGIRSEQPFEAWVIRAMLSVCYAEKAIYEIPDNALTPERIKQEIRAVEQRLILLEDGSPRPTLAVPHLLSGESSAYYHGYVLAEMAVYQTREYFKTRDGHLTDNTKIGPELREHYWRAGNSRRFKDFVRDLTGKPLTAEALANHANRTAEQALSEARRDIDHLQQVPEYTGDIALNTRVKVMHRNEVIASNEAGFGPFAAQFGEWIKSQE